MSGGKVLRFPTKPGAVAQQVRNCKTCAHFSPDPSLRDHIHFGSCGLYPRADFHDVTNRICAPSNDKRLWMPKPTQPGWLKRFVAWVW